MVGIKGLGKIEPGAEVLVDGYEGLFIVSPSEQTKADYGAREHAHDVVEAKLDELRETLPVTLDGRRLTVAANMELLEDVPLIKEHGAEGIGLMRTEYLFLNEDEFPSEDKQAEIYTQMARASLPNPIIIRTLDVGATRSGRISASTRRSIRFLGFRGIRYSMGRPDLFRTQLRAICRANTEGNVKIMFPMVSDVTEVKFACGMLQEVRAELRGEGVAQPESMDCGVMIEVPSAALIADVLARHVNFFSIGSNDLIQYTLAIDRGNEKVSAMYQPAHPAVVRLLKTVADAAHQNNIWVGVCGEMASDVVLMPLLVGLGIDELSAIPNAIPRIKRAIQSLSYEEAKEMVARFVQSETAQQNQQELDAIAKRLYPEIL